MYAMFASLKLSLIDSINRDEMRLVELSDKIQELTVYSGNISDGVITPGEMMNSPASIFNMQMGFMGFNAQKSWNQAGMLTPYYMNQQNAINQGTQGHYQMAYDPTMTQQLNPVLLFQSFFKQALEAGAKSELEHIKAEETKITQEQERIKSHLKIKEKELDWVEKQEDKGLERLFPKN